MCAAQGEPGRLLRFPPGKSTMLHPVSARRGSSFPSPFPYGFLTTNAVVALVHIYTAAPGQV